MRLPAIFGSLPACASVPAMNRANDQSTTSLLAQFRALQANQTLTPASALMLAEQAAAHVIAHFHTTGTHARDAVRLLCELAAHPDDEIARAGTIGIFPLLVERLNDSFDPAACQLYDRVFTQIITFFRHLPEAAAFDEALNAFGLHTEFDLLARKQRLTAHGTEPGAVSTRSPWQDAPSETTRSLSLPVPHLRPSANQPKPQNPKPKIIFLSRVTIGADVAITSVLMAKLRCHLPDAEFVLLGSPKLTELYGGDARIRVRPIAYERGGRMTERLLSWLAILEAVQEETSGLAPDDFLIIDPDSRLTQLGLLPLLSNDVPNYLFFESRSFDSMSTAPLGALASQWLGQWLDDNTPAFPFVALPQPLIALGQQVRALLPATKRTITISLGVGGNDAKRIPGSFEQDLIEHLLADSALILDKGASDAERAQVDAIVATLRAQGRNVIELNEQNVKETLRQDNLQAEVVTWDGSIGSFAVLIAASDQYIGYDSAGQHIAAALGVPTLTFFVNANSERFAHRWQPYGQGTIKLLLVTTSEVAEGLCAEQLAYLHDLLAES